MLMGFTLLNDTSNISDIWLKDKVELAVNFYITNGYSPSTLYYYLSLYIICIKSRIISIYYVYNII